MSPRPFCISVIAEIRSISFKRKQKSPYLSNDRSESPLPRPASARQNRQNRARASTNPSTGAILSYLNAPGDAGADLQDAKDPNALDWYVEGPGRRVGYDDLTAIDWIFEYSKERQRLRVLHANSPGLLGHLRIFADNGQIWAVLVLTGIAVGAIAASIDVVSDWLGDFKTGYCSNQASGGRFYLNKYFCCWGLESTSAWHVEQRNAKLTALTRFRRLHGLAILEHCHGRQCRWW